MLFRTRQAYIKFRGMTAGLAWSTFNDLMAVPPTIDYQGPNAANEVLNYQIRYTQKLGVEASYWKLAISARLASNSSGVSKATYALPLSNSS